MPSGAEVGVVIRCHDQGRFLAEAVGSVLGQSSPVAVVVVVDDGSVDETAAVLEELRAASPLIRSVSRSPARGAVASLNDGIDAAGRVDLLCVLDADDRLSTRYVEQTTEALCGRPELGFAYGGVQWFGAVDRWEEPRPADLDVLLVGNVVPVTALFRRSVYEAVGPFDPRFEGIGFEDWDYWTRVVAAGFAGVPVDGCWLEYRRHDTGSRNVLRPGRRLRARAAVWGKHRARIRPRHFAGWLAASAGHRLGRAA